VFLVFLIFNVTGEFFTIKSGFDRNNHYFRNTRRRWTPISEQNKTKNNMKQFFPPSSPPSPPPALAAAPPSDQPTTPGLIMEGPPPNAPKKARRGGPRAAAITCNNPSADVVKSWSSFLANTRFACYAVCAREVGASGTPHLQGRAYAPSSGFNKNFLLC
jgi:hypothetical protein